MYTVSRLTVSACENLTISRLQMHSLYGKSLEINEDKNAVSYSFSKPPSRLIVRTNFKKWFTIRFLDSESNFVEDFDTKFAFHD